MTAEISMFLSGKPTWEIQGLEGVELDDEFIDRMRLEEKEPNQCLDASTDILKKLLQNGWGGRGAPYDIYLIKDLAVGKARHEVIKLGLDPNLASEFDDDGESIPAAVDPMDR